MRTFCRRRVCVQMFVAALLVAAGGAGVSGGNVLQGDAGTIKFTDIDTKKKGTVVAKGTAEPPKGYVVWASKEAFKIRADPVTFLGKPDDTRKSVSGTGQQIFANWDGTITGVPAGRYHIVVEITFINPGNEKDKKTISKSSGNETVK
jgi:hypothetical protein